MPLPIETIHYKSYVKESLVEALRNVFADHPDQLLRKTKVDIDFSTDQADYPAIIVRFYERTIHNAGVGHYEWLPPEDNPPGTNEIQTVEVTATGGTFKLGFDGTETVDIPFDATADDLRLALEYPCGPANIEVTGGPGGTAPFQITFVENLAETNVSPLVPNEIDLNGTITVNTLTEGIPRIQRFLKFKHYLYAGDIEFGVYALTSMSRDLTSDALVQILAFPDLLAYTNKFLKRIYSPFVSDEPIAKEHYVNINTDQIQGFGESQQVAPWMPEDTLVYQTSYRVGITGEFYSLVPKIPPLYYVERVDLYPWDPTYQIKPDPNPEDEGEWIS